MQAPIEQTLHILLPTANVIPAQLISTSSALLAQSKNAAPALKGDEEIARTYACCHIACQRLAPKLSLDIGKVLPPCKPTIYKKLHAFLDKQLTAGLTSQSSTPRTQKTVDILKPRTPTPARSVNAEFRGTLVRTPSALRIEAIDADDAVVTPSISAKNKRKRQQDESLVLRLPAQLTQLTSHLCESARVPQAAASVLTALGVVYDAFHVEQPARDEDATPNKRQRKASTRMDTGKTKTGKFSVEADQIPLVVLVLCQTAISRIRHSTLSPDETDNLFAEVISFLRDKDEDLAERVYTTDYAKVAKVLEDMTDNISRLSFWNGWLDSLPRSTLELSGNDDEDGDVIPIRAMPSKTPLRRREKHGSVDYVDELPGASGLLPGLGTMFQASVDWLSDERRATYAAWEQSIMKEIAQIEQRA